MHVGTPRAVQDARTVDRPRGERLAPSVPRYAEQILTWDSRPWVPALRSGSSRAPGDDTMRTCCSCHPGRAATSREPGPDRIGRPSLLASGATPLDDDASPSCKHPSRLKPGARFSTASPPLFSTAACRRQRTRLAFWASRAPRSTCRHGVPRALQDAFLRASGGSAVLPSQDRADLGRRRGFVSHHHSGIRSRRLFRRRSARIGELERRLVLTSLIRRWTEAMHETRGEGEDASTASAQPRQAQCSPRS